MVGTFLRSTRESLGLTQAEVADRTRNSPWQLSRAAVSAIERGQNFPGLEAMLALSNVLEIDPKELIERARLAAVVPADLEGLADDELESRASQYFWAGDFRNALAAYDTLAHRLAGNAPDESEDVVARRATLELRRAATLKRAGALVSAIASAERAISLSSGHPEIQAEAYMVLCGLQCLRGHLPLARDAAVRAVELAASAGPKVQARAWISHGQILYQSDECKEAREAMLTALELADAGDDAQHVSHIEGNIGLCNLALGDSDTAREWIERALETSRRRTQPTLEARWLIELAGIAFTEGALEQADHLACDALNIARPREHHVTVFRAEWLRHKVRRVIEPEEPDLRRLSQLRQLYREIEAHDGFEELHAFRAEILEVESTSRGTGDEID